jgi:hypothetical protein
MNFDGISCKKINFLFGYILYITTQYWMRVSKHQVELLAKRYKIDLNIISLDTLMIGTKVELEHGKRYGKHSKATNVIGTNVELAFKIVLGHLVEFPNYY